MGAMWKLRGTVERLWKGLDWVKDYAGKDVTTLKEAKDRLELIALYIENLLDENKLEEIMAAA
jgi:hypothetical protein